MVKQLLGKTGFIRRQRENNRKLKHVWKEKGIRYVPSNLEKNTI